jgi:cysteine desulfuration protein SufE
LSFMDPDIQDLIDAFAALPGWEERYALLIDMGRALPPMDPALRTEGARVRGCTSNVWMVGGVKDGRFRFIADSDAQIVRGLIALLRELLHDRPAEEVAAADVEGVFAALGLAQHISASRRNGFSAMLARARDMAASG